MGEDKHHIIPSSRKGSNKRYNITIVNAKLHSFYHRLFGNRTPDEIISFLVDIFWKGDWEWVEKSLRTKYVQEPKCINCYQLVGQLCSLTHEIKYQPHKQVCDDWKEDECIVEAKEKRN